VNTLPRPLRLQLLIVRTAMLFGVLAFGAVTWFLQREGVTPSFPPATIARFTGGFYIVGALTLVGLVLVRLGLNKATVDQQKFMYLGGYAATEVVAILGGVIWYTGGDRTWYIVGLVLMAVSFQILPLRRD
jgi:hypothetical protein